MAISSYKTFLMVGSGTSSITYTKLIDIKDFPDLGGDPETLDTTTLSDKMKTYIMGIQDAESLAFTANYTWDEYKTLLESVGVRKHYAVWFGGTESNGSVTPTGDMGKFTFEGQLSLKVNGAGVNEVVNLTLTIIPNTEITPVTE